MSTIAELGDRAPQWLREARTVGATVEIVDDEVVWHGGEWLGGVWCGGEWRAGWWNGGVWCGGEWRAGWWNGGVWLCGAWRGGTWYRGMWHGGVVSVRTPSAGEFGHDVRLLAAEKIRHHGWCVGDYRDGDGRYSLPGALCESGADLFGEVDIGDWSEAPGRTKEEVLAWLEGRAQC